MKTNEYYIKEYIQSRGLSKKSETSLRYMLNHYSNYNQLPLDELILEADTEEENGIRWKRRTLKTRLINYMNYCKETMTMNSAKSYVGKVKAFYTHNEIEIGHLPPWNNKNAHFNNPIKPDDLPTKEIIMQALELSNPLMKAIILSLISTGMAKIDLLGLTIQDFLTSTYETHHKSTIQEAIPIILKDDSIIPCFEKRRHKNNKYYVTFMTPEATHEICNYLLIRDKRNHKYHRPLIQPEDPLFKISQTTYGDKFVEINNTLKLGTKGTYNRFRGHMLRKYHATQLEKHGMNREHIRTLQGKSNSKVDEAYFYMDKKTLLEEYKKHMQGLLIYTEIKEINTESKEYQELLKQNKEYKENLDSIYNRLEELEQNRLTWEEYINKE